MKEVPPGHRLPSHGIPGLRTFVLTFFALAAFASNSLVCRLALRADPGFPAAIDPGAFTVIRLLSGAAMLGLVLGLRSAYARESAAGSAENITSGGRTGGSWLSALALFLYAIFFSFAYLRLTAGAGALILFGSVQAAMICWGMYKGARPGPGEWFGLGLALFGLAYLVAPGLSAPDPIGAACMAMAGISWGAYSLRGKGVRDPLAATAGNFLLSLAWAAPWAVLLLLASFKIPSAYGMGLAVASGALASGLGYVIWYMAIPGLKAARAAAVQLLVPVLSALGGGLFLGEALTLRLLLSGVLVLAGIALVILYPEKGPSDR